MLIYLALLETDGERQLFLTLYARYGNAMLVSAKKQLGGDLDAAEDVVQNSWIRAVEHFSRIQEIPDDKKGAYLLVITRNEAISFLRRRRKELPLEEDMPDPGARTAEDGTASILEIIRGMPETYRAVLEMRFVEEQSTRKIARHLGLTESAVNTRIHRGRKLLIQKLEEEGYTV